MQYFRIASNLKMQIISRNTGMH